MSGTSKLAYLILTLVIGYVFIYSPFGDIKSLMEKKDQYLKSLETIQNIENVKNELLTKFNDISEEDKKSINTVLPNSLDFVKLIAQIDTVAAAYGISIKETGYQELNSSGGDSIETAQPAKVYKSAIVNFSFDTNYENFRKFMDDLGRSMRVLDIRTVELTTSEKGIYSYRVGFETYWLQQTK